MLEQKPPMTPQELEAMEKLLVGVQSQLGPSAEFTIRMQKRLERHHALMQERSQAGNIVAKRGLLSFFSTRVYSALTAFAFVIFTGGLSTFAYTSDSITNGNALYPIKRGLEGIERTFAGTPGAQAEYQMKLLSRRLAESRFLTLRGVVDEPTNQDVSVVINDGILAIQAIEQADYRDQLLDRITTLLQDEEKRIYNTAGVPVPTTVEISPDSVTSSDSVSTADPDTSSVPAVRADTAPSASLEARSGASIQNITSPSDAPILDDTRAAIIQRQSENDKRTTPSDGTSRRNRDRSETSDTPSVEENVAVPLHVRPGVIEALQRNREHLKRMEVRVTEMRRRR